MKSLNFSFVRLHTLFFYIFLLIFPFNIRKTFLSDYSYFTGHFVENATYFLNLSDFFLVLAIVFAAAYILKNNLQNDFLGFLKKYQCIFWTLGALVLWSFLGILYAKNQTLVLAGTVKTLEFSVLFVYVTYFLRDFSRLLTSWRIITLGGVIQSIVAIIQYTTQKSLGLKILGESIIGRDLPGVAKIVVDGEKVIRSYGTFGHPNILGGFLVFSLSISLLLYVLKEKKTLHVFYLMFIGFASIMFFDHYTVTNQQGQILWWLLLGMLFAILVGYRISDKKITDEYHMSNRLSYFIVIIQAIALLVTFSRTAWLAFGVVIIGVTILFFKKIIKKSRYKILGVLLIGVIVSFIFSPFKTRMSDSFDITNQAIRDRILGIQTAFTIIKKHPLMGIGNKNYVINIDTYETRQLNYWQYQPVHNSYLLVWSELGLIGLILFIIFTVFIIAHHLIFRSVRED